MKRILSIALVLMFTLTACMSAFAEADYTELVRGSKGDAVTAVQERLAELGYYTVKITGKYDTETQKAMKRFEKANGLKNDGDASPEDQAVLFSELAVDVNGSTQAAEPTEEPLPEITAEPMPEPVVTEAPVPVETEAPLPVVTEAPAPIETEAPELPGAGEMRFFDHEEMAYEDMQLAPQKNLGALVIVTGTVTGVSGRTLYIAPYADEKLVAVSYGASKDFRYTAGDEVVVYGTLVGTVSSEARIPSVIASEVFTR